MRPRRHGPHEEKDDGLAELYNSKFKEAITSLSAWRERLENPQQEKSKEMLKEAGEVVQTLKTDMAAWKKLEDVYAPSSASTDVTPSGPRKRKAPQHSGSKRGAPTGERKACPKGGRSSVAMTANGPCSLGCDREWRGPRIRAQKSKGH